MNHYKLPHGMGSIAPYKKGVRYRRTYQGMTLSVTASTPEEAMMKMQEKINDTNVKLSLFDNKFMPLGDAILQYIETFKQRTVKATSYDRVEKTINNQIKNFPIGQKYIAAITSADIQKHINTLTDKYAFSTVKKTYEILHQYFEFFYKRSPQDNPMLLVTKPREKNCAIQTKDPIFYNDEEIEKFKKEALYIFGTGKPKHKFGLVFMAMMYLGLRESEMRALTWDDIDFEKHLLTVDKQRVTIINRNKKDSSEPNRTHITTDPKTDKGTRTITIPITAENYLLKYQKQCPNKYLFYSNKTGKPVTVTTMSFHLHAIQKAAGLPISGLHTLRHTCCSLLARKGVNEVVIAQILGHKNLDMIHYIYEHVTETQVDEAMRNL